MDPYRLKGLEVYSTVLWHCKREVGRRAGRQNKTGWGERGRHQQLPCRPSCKCCVYNESILGGRHLRFVQVELAQVAQVASSLDRHSPYAWCVLGNCFSLQKVRRQRAGWVNRAAGWL